MKINVVMIMEGVGKDSEPLYLSIDSHINWDTFNKKMVEKIPKNKRAVKYSYFDNVDDKITFNSDIELKEAFSFAHTNDNFLIILVEANNNDNQSNIRNVNIISEGSELDGGISQNTGKGVEDNNPSTPILLPPNSNKNNSNNIIIDNVTNNKNGDNNIVKEMFFLFKERIDQLENEINEMKMQMKKLLEVNRNLQNNQMAEQNVSQVHSSSEADNQCCAPPLFSLPPSIPPSSLLPSLENQPIPPSSDRNDPHRYDNDIRDDDSDDDDSEEDESEEEEEDSKCDLLPLEDEDEDEEDEEILLNAVEEECYVNLQAMGFPITRSLVREHRGRFSSLFDLFL